MESFKLRGLLRRRSCWVPTWRGWLAVGLLFGIAAVATARRVHPFLAVTQRVSTEELVVEGWIPDFALQAGIEEFLTGKYRRILVSGGPLEKGEPLSEYRTYAEFGRATLERLGCPTNELRAVPAIGVRHDRTYAAAVALRAWLTAQAGVPRHLNVVTADSHARRTRLLFQKAFGDDTVIGIIAVPDERFDATRWWRSSMGFRTVTGELIAYFYARFLFSPPEELSRI
jgi:uncharacterized SAM-binding protein YcdF (DUF218 family)